MASLEDEAAELGAAIRELAREFERAADGGEDPLHRARRLVEAGWNRRCFSCENRTSRRFVGERDGDVSDRGTVKKVGCCGHRGYCNGFRGDLDTYRCECPCHDSTGESPCSAD